MNRLTCSLSTALVVLVGCPMPNPAFDEHADGTDGATSDGNTDAPAETGSTLDSGSEDPSTGDGDPVDTGMEAPDILDLPPDTCEVPLHGALKPTFGNPAFLEGGCGAEVEYLVKVFDTDGTNWLVGMCDGSCSFCTPNTLHPLGAPSLSLAALLQPPINNQDPYAGCYIVNAEGLVSEQPSGCLYSSISVIEYGYNWPVFAATRDNWGLTAPASEILGGWSPVLQVEQSCACEELDPNVAGDCCNAETLTTYSLNIGGIAPVKPGASDTALIGDATFEVHAAQAQSGLSCEVPYEVSWALVDVE